MKRRAFEITFALAICLWQGYLVASDSDMMGTLTNVFSGFMTGIIAASIVRSWWVAVFVPLSLAAAIVASREFLDEGAGLSWQLIALVLAASALGAAVVAVVFHLRESRAEAG